MGKFMESKPKILFVTQSLDGDARACGIGLIGALLGQALLTHETYNFDIIYTNHWNEIIEKVNSFNPDAIIYNYAPGTTPWLNEEHPRSSITVPQLRIMHDMHQKLADEYTPEKNFGWKYIIADDPSVTGNDMVFTTNRLIKNKIFLSSDSRDLVHHTKDYINSRTKYKKNLMRQYLDYIYRVGISKICLEVLKGITHTLDPEK
jgi:hypothetical protein